MNKKNYSIVIIILIIIVLSNAVDIGDRVFKPICTYFISEGGILCTHREHIIDASSILLLFLIAYYTIYKLYDKATSSLSFSFFRGEWCVEPCNFADLNQIDTISNNVFGDESSNIEQIRRIYSIDHKSFWKVFKRRDDGKISINGYFCIYKISKSGISAIKNGTFNGANPDRAWLDTSNQKNKKTYYIGAIYSKSRYGKAAALSGINAIFNERNPSALFARAATEDGIRSLNSNKFEPVTPRRVGIGAYYTKNFRNT
ncbi:hypothetical protein [Breoghania sp. JC706]|uniref:hypothetical protein n=1 Tax=Breoghania sp. JC706 TaxID=3117732 RepID=UPI003009F1C0